MLRTGAQNIVTRKGLGTNLLLVIITMILVLPSFIPYVGIIRGWLLTSITWLMVASAYVQQVDEDDGSLADLLPEPDAAPEEQPELAGGEEWAPVS